MIRKTFWIAKEVFDRLDLLAKKDGLKVADLVRRAVIEFVKREEWERGEGGRM